MMLAVSVSAGTGWGAPPSSITRLSGNSTFTEEQQAAVRSYAEYWTNELAAASDDRAEVRAIRQRILSPFSGVSTSPAFRRLYGNAVAAGLEPVLEGDDDHLAVNALIILGKLDTEEALRTLVSYSAAGRRGRTPVLRLTAARSAAETIRHVQVTPISMRQITRAARDLADAAREETEPSVLPHQLSAILAADRRDLDEESRATARQAFADALANVVDRASADPANGDLERIRLLAATHRALVDVRDHYLRLDPIYQRELGVALSPTLAEILEVGVSHWDAVRAAEDQKELSERLGELFEFTETLLSTIDAIARTGQRAPRTQLAQAWRQGQRDRFEAAVQQWQSVMGGAPYRRR